MKTGKNIIVYNTLSNALMEIDKESYSLLFESRNTQKLSTADFDEDLWEALCINNIISDNDTDDYLKYKASITNITKTADWNASYSCSDYGLLFPLPLLFREIQGEKVYDSGNNGSNY